MVGEGGWIWKGRERGENSVFSGLRAGVFSGMSANIVGWDNGMSCGRKEHIEPIYLTKSSI